MLGLAVVIALLTFSRAWGVYDLTPGIQDYILLSIAAGKAGDDAQELRWAHAALRQRPDHPDALACAVTAFYNLKLRGYAPEKEFPEETWALQAQRVASIPEPAKSVRLVQAIVLWKLGNAEQARKVLRSLQESSPSDPGSERIRDDALGVLLLAGLGDPRDQSQAERSVDQTSSFYLLVALSRQETAARQLSPSRRTAVTEAEPLVRNIFP